MSQIRCRFAPSPTGMIHIGNMRTTLFNWLFARHQGGTFVLRLEDTDLARSEDQYEDTIYEEMRWLGLTWDEGPDIGGAYGPYRQTERTDTYRDYADRLLASGHVYECFCSQEELDQARATAEAKGETYRYDGRCRGLSKEERDRLRAEGKVPALRFHVPENQVVGFDDLIRGRIEFNTNEIGDFIIIRSNGIPVYNFANVVDDASMKITHIIRGAEHIINTPIQILLYQALDLPVPQFAHGSLVLGQDKSKLSKRKHSEAFVTEFRRKGYLPEALFNFLALLGWSPKGEQEILSREQIIEQFSLENVSRSPAVFDLDKLNWINGHYIRQTPVDRITDLAIPHLKEAGYITGEPDADTYRWLTGMVAAVQDRLDYVAQIVDHVGIFFSDDFILDDEAKSVMSETHVPELLKAFTTALRELDALNEENVKPLFKSVGKQVGVAGKKVFMPIRVALTGQLHGPELAHIIPVLGYERIAKRLARWTMNGIE
ncbi:MAG: glutamate--tRNA ligase [Bacillota bacterium]